MAKELKWDYKWRFGGNFTPSTAINQLEMWQADTFDLPTIDRELGWAENIGMSVMRVYLHDLLWVQDRDGFIDRIGQYLKCADSHGIKTMFVFFDDCWSPDFALGKQPDPKPFTHNSGWVQSPGEKVADDPSQWGRLEKYVKDILNEFRHDERILLWDLYNEPGNGRCGDHISKTGLRENASLPLLKKVFQWAREADPDQPLTAGLWKFEKEFDELNRFSAEQSDVLSFHAYMPPEPLIERINLLRLIANGKPLLCSEYMARTAGSTFAECTPIFKQHNIIAINWGLVEGKTNTIYPWEWNESKGIPNPFFHDVFHQDGTLLYPEEAEVFREMRKE